MAPHREKSPATRRGRFRVESLEGRVLLSEAAAWLGQTDADLVGRDGRNPDGYQDVGIRLLGLDPSRSISRVDVQRQGGGLWAATTSSTANAALVRSQDPTGAWSSQADLYLEPYFNDPVQTRYEQIRITYSDSTTVLIKNLLSTSAVDINQRVQGDELGVVWIGQDGLDLTSPGAAVGPDGIQDLHLKLSNLLSYQRLSDGWLNRFDVDRDQVVVTMPKLDGTSAVWVAGPRPTGVALPYNRAEIIVNQSDPSRADLYLSPVAGLAPGGIVTVKVSYQGIGKGDASPNAGASGSQLVATIATTPNPDLAAAALAGPSRPISFAGPTASWAGQDGRGTATPGFVHVVVSGLPVGWAVADLTLSDNFGLTWTPGNANPARALTIRHLADPTKADLSFPAVRDESDAVMTLRFSLVGSTTQYVSQFHGGSADPTLRDPGPADTEITVDPSFVSQPGTDLNTLVGMFGTIRLKAGIYNLSRPLDLVNSVKLLAEPGAVFLFSQSASDAAWSYAIKVRKSHTTLDGLTIRFAAPIRWTNEFQMSPAVIGSTYSNWNFGPNPKVDLNFRNLDVEYSPAPGSGDGYNLSNVRLIRSNIDDSGVIAGNTLRGGNVEVWGGPWTIADNDYRGAAANSSVTPAFAVRNGIDVTVERNHAHQDDRSGITYGFLLFTGFSQNTIVRDNVVDGGFGRDAAVSPGGAYNFPELILTEAYYPRYEGFAQVNGSNSRLLQVSTLRGAPGQSGDVVAILSGPSAGRWFRIAQAIDAQNYLVDGDLPLGTYAVSITRGFVNGLYERNTLDTSSLARSSSVGFQLAGTQIGTVVRNNLVIGAKPFFLSSGPTQESLPGSTPYPAPWGWTHLPVLDLTIEGNTFRDPVFWSANAPANAPTPVAAATLTVEHGGLVRDNQGRLYLTASVTDNTFAYSEAFLAGVGGGDLVALQVGDNRTIDPAEMNLLEFSGNVVKVPAAFTAAGRAGTIRFDSGLLVGKTVASVVALPAPSTAPPQLTARTLNQDGSDYVGWSSTPGPNGYQDVHLILSGLRTDVGIRTVDVYPYGAGHNQYAAPGLPSNTPGLDPGAWRVAVVQPQDGPARFSPTADLYMQPFRVENGRSHWDVRVTYLDGSTTFVPVFGIVADPSLKVGDGAARIAATSLGQDGSDFVGTSPTAGPDGYQDLHFVLTGLPTDKEVAQVDVSPYGYGRYQYVAPQAPPLPAVPQPGILARDSRNWRAVFVQPALGSGRYSTTADLYVPSVRAENGVQPGTNDSNHYDVQITFTDGSTTTVVVWGVVGDPTAKVGDLTARSYGQDGSDFASPSPTLQSDGVPDVHLSLSGLRTDQAVAQVEVWGDGGGEWTYQGTTFRSAAKLVRAGAAGGFASTADLYIAADSSFLGADGRLRPQTLKIVVRYADGSTSRQTIIPGVTADPALGRPVVTSLGQDGHDLARLAVTAGPDGNQDVHLVLSNLPTDLPLARVVVRRQAGGAVYQSNGSNGAWVAVAVQERFGPASFASTADVYFEPASGLHDVNQPYVIEIYLGDASRLSYTLTTAVTADAGLAMVAAPSVTAIRAMSTTESPTAEVQAVSSPTPAAVVAPTATPATTTAKIIPTTTGSTTATMSAETGRVPRGPLGLHRRRPKSVGAPHHAVTRAELGLKGAANAKAWVLRRNQRKQRPV